MHQSALMRSKAVGTAQHTCSRNDTSGRRTYIHPMADAYYRRTTRRRFGPNPRDQAHYPDPAVWDASESVLDSRLSSGGSSTKAAHAARLATKAGTRPLACPPCPLAALGPGARLVALLPTRTRRTGSCSTPRWGECQSFLPLVAPDRETMHRLREEVRSHSCKRAAGRAPGCTTTMPQFVASYAQYNQQRDPQPSRFLEHGDTTHAGTPSSTVKSRVPSEVSSRKQDSHPQGWLSLHYDVSRTLGGIKDCLAPAPLQASLRFEHRSTCPP